jgi:Tol biopolymer transport system component
MRRALLLLIVPPACLLLTATSLGAEQPKPFKRVVGGIAYPCVVRYVGWDWPELCVTSREGLTSDKVTNTPNREIDPVWSPDGTRLAYAVNGRIEVKSIWRRECPPEEYCDPWVGKVRALTTGGADSEPDWSPTGTRLVYVSRRSGNAELYVSPAAGGAQTRVTNNGQDDVHPSWSPQGGPIAFSRASTLYTISADGRRERALGQGRSPTWSPDGTQLAFEWQGDIWVARADGSRRRNITRSTAVQETDPTWAPDGERVAFPGLSVGEALFDMYVVRPGRTPIRFRTGGDRERPFTHPSVDWQEIGPQIFMTVGGRRALTLRDRTGRRLRTIRAGELAIVYVDRSPKHGFASSIKSDSGYQVLPPKSVPFVGRRVIWGSINIRPGVYRYWCPAHPKTERGTFRVVDDP